ncbi:hypothetical protein ACIBOV_24450, partial [Micromonospora chersina]|uniref:hypothetical protein n=1 Tax=Micromonospora chersina TaxID=47854 RepID=UPI0037B732B1
AKNTWLTTPTPAWQAALKTQNRSLMEAFNFAVRSHWLQTPTPAWQAALKTQTTQLRAVLGSLDTETTYRMVLTRPQGLQAAAIDAALENLEQAVVRADQETGSEVRLLTVWAESLREFGAWLREPVVTWSSVALVWFVVSYWWVTLKTERPDVADMIEVPFTLFAGVLLPAAIAAAKKRK